MNMEKPNPEQNSDKKLTSNSLCLGTLIYIWYNKKPQFIISLLLILISLVVIIVFLALQLNLIYSFNYAIVIDAGSTGTRAYLYEWLDSPDTVNDDVNETASCKTDKFQNLFPNSTSKLLNCISSLLGKVKASYVIKPRIYLAATAGMRLYKIENPQLTDKMFHEIETQISNKGWMPVFNGIISGEKEAISAWITTNVLKRTIGKNKYSNGAKTFGSLDLGGASTQIAFETNSNLNTNDLEIYKERHPIYSKSYLCYGANMFYVLYYTSVTSDPSATGYHCLLKNGIIVPNDFTKTCQAKGFNQSQTLKPINTDSVKCRQQIRNILTKDLQQIKIDQDEKFIAVSSFFYYHSFLKKNYNISDTLASFISGTDQFCMEDYNDLKIKYPNNWKYYTNYCFVGNYIINLLRIYGFDDNSFKNIEFTEKIEKVNVGWSLGFVIDQTRLIPDSIIYRLNTAVFAVFLTLSFLCLLIILLLFLFMVWERRQKVGDINV